MLFNMTHGYQEVFENRISNAKINMDKFRKQVDRGQSYSIDCAMLIHSPISRMSYHRMSKKDQEIYSDFDWNQYK